MTRGANLLRRGARLCGSTVTINPLRAHHLRCFTTRPRRCAATATVENENDVIDGPKRFAVIGGGFAGLAIAWNLLALTGGHGPTSVDLFDAVGLAGGGSGASAGLLHPYNPRGQMLWKGREALVAALKLISAAELAAGIEDSKRRPFVWRQPILRTASNAKQAKEFSALRRSMPDRSVSTMMASPLTPDQALQMVPGLEAASLLEGHEHAALLIQGGLVLDPHRYLRALWDACRQISKDAGQAAEVRLIREKVTSLHTLEAIHGPYSAVVVAAGAANSIIEEVGDRLGCSLSQGYVLQLVPDELKSVVPPETRSGDEARSNKTNAAEARTAAMVASTSASIPSPKHSQAQSEPVAKQSEAGEQGRESRAPSEAEVESTSQSGTSESGGAAAEPLAGIRWPSIGGTDAADDSQALTLASLQSEARENRALERQHGESTQPSTSQEAASEQLSDHNTLPEPAEILQEIEEQQRAKETAAESSGQADASKEAPLRGGPAGSSTWHWKRPFTPVFSLDTGPGFVVRGKNEGFESCLREPSTSTWADQQMQIRMAVGLQIDPMRDPIPEQAQAEKLEDALSDGWDTEEDPSDAEMGEGYPEGAPSLLSSKYIAVQGRHRIILGATRRNGLTPEEAFQECGRKVVEEAEIEEASRALLPDGERLWKPVNGWRVRRVRTGVRALPPRTEKGAMPLAGRLEDGFRWWVVGGLGARGLVYHAWLGELVAQAVLNDTEEGLPKELLRWKSCPIDPRE